jgi:hypothetical protein
LLSQKSDLERRREPLWRALKDWREFGEAKQAVLDTKATLASSRGRSQQNRTKLTSLESAIRQLRIDLERDTRFELLPSRQMPAGMRTNRATHSCSCSQDRGY